MILGKTYSEYLANINASMELFQSLGFIVNEKKSSI